MKLLSSIPRNRIPFARSYFIILAMSCRILILINCCINALSAFPQVPTSLPKKGRTVFLENINKILDDGNELIIQSPRDPMTGSDGSLYFAEGPSVYKYRGGHQIFCAGKKGEGPGECQSVYCFTLLGETLYVQADIPPKIIAYSASGALIKEWPSDPRRLFWKLFSAKGELYGLIDEMHSHPERFAMNGYVESEFSLNHISLDFKKIRHVTDISMLTFIKNGSYRRMGQLNIAVHDSYLFVLHSDKYLIDRIDLKSGLVDKTISRPFSSKKGEFDIKHICFQGNRLWVVTSECLNRSPDRLIDLYNVDGALIDAYCLHFPDLTVDYWIGNFVISTEGILSIIQENRTDGYLSIAQYRIL